MPNDVKIRKSKVYSYTQVRIGKQTWRQMSESKSRRRQLEAHSKDRSILRSTEMLPPMSCCHWPLVTWYETWYSLVVHNSGSALDSPREL